MVILHSEKGCKKIHTNMLKTTRRWGSIRREVGRVGVLGFCRKGATRRFPLTVVTHPLRTRAPAQLSADTLLAARV